jgi:hypothetical protein
MMCFAHYSGFTDITLEAVSMLNQQEYAGQAIGLLNTMDLLEGMGCKITCPMRDAWAKKASASGIEWKNFHPITVYHLIPS